MDKESKVGAFHPRDTLELPISPVDDVTNAICEDQQERANGETEDVENAEDRVDR